MTCGIQLIIGYGVEYSQLLYVLYPHVIHSENITCKHNTYNRIACYSPQFCTLEILMPVARPMVATAFQLLLSYTYVCVANITYHDLGNFQR